MRKPAGQIDWSEALERVRTFMSQHGADLSVHQFLLAVSGGMDSMCLLEAMHAVNARIGIAHMNYQLRGRDSDLDAALVRNTCSSYHLVCHEKTVDLKRILENTPGNVQLTARNLRYAWFDELLKSEGYHFVLTAHHQDDAVETFFINLIRGTGLRGLTGIPEKRDQYLRPMMCFRREEISLVVNAQGIAYREDASNDTLDYLRNRVRNTILPVFETESENFASRVYRTQERLKAEYTILESSLRDFGQQLVSTDQDRVCIDRAALQKTPAPPVVLFNIVKKFGFSYPQCIAAAGHQGSAGVRFLSQAYEMQLDRNNIFIVPSPMTQVSPESLTLEAPGEYILPEGRLSMTLTTKPEFAEDRNIEFADALLIGHHIALRKWNAGDVFYPLGSGGKQKLQDFFTNEKFSPQEKTTTWIVTANNEIVWVVGRRLDERFKITEDTRSVLKLEWIPAGD